MTLTTLQEKMREKTEKLCTDIGLYDMDEFCNCPPFSKDECRCETRKEKILSFISQAISTAYKQGVRDAGESIIGDPVDNYIAWREYVNGEYEKGRKDKKSRVILAYQEWLYDEQNRRLKELLIHTK